MSKVTLKASGRLSLFHLGQKIEFDYYDDDIDKYGNLVGKITEIDKDNGTITVDTGKDDG